MGATEDQALMIQEDPSSDQKYEGPILEEPLMHLISWIINDVVMSGEDDEVEGSRRSLPMKQIKISIQSSFHDIVWLYICLYSVDV